MSATIGVFPALTRRRRSCLERHDSCDDDAMVEARALVGGNGSRSSWRATLARVRSFLTPARSTLAGRVVLLPSISTELGPHLAAELARRGAIVALAGADEVALSSAAQRVVESGSRAVTFSCDVTDAETAEALVEEAHQALGRIDVIVNESDAFAPRALAGYSVEDVEETVRASFWRPVHVTLRALPRLRKQGVHARIVNVTHSSKARRSSLWRRTPATLGLDGFTAALRDELRDGRSHPKVIAIDVHHAVDGFAGHAELDDLEPLDATDMERICRSVVDAIERGRPELHLRVRRGVSRPGEIRFAEPELLPPRRALGVFAAP